MGLLDEAIREHLDLKRRRGADPTEVERLEREALGPVRRGRETAESPDLPEHLTDVPDELAQPEWDDAFGDETPAVGDLERPEQEAYERRPPAAEPPNRNAPVDHEDLPPIEEPPSRPAPAADPPSDAFLTEPGQGEHETAEFDVKRALEGESPKKEDMLEETPEFLQDTPDHDRLWFEQRPPKDFDFDH